MKIKSDQAGLAQVVVVALVVLVVGVVGFVGWKVWDNKDDAKQNNTQAIDTPAPASNAPSTDSSSVAERSTDNPASWYQFVSKNSEYKLRLANGLTFEKSNNTWLTLYTSSLSPSNNSKAKVVDSTSGTDRSVGTGLSVTYYETGTETKGFGKLQTSFKTDSGLSVDKYSYDVETEVDSIGIEKGGKLYNYLISKEGTNLVVRYGIAPSDRVNTELVEKMVKTAELK